MYLHIVATRNNAQLNPQHPQYNKQDIVVHSRSEYHSLLECLAAVH